MDKPDFKEYGGKKGAVRATYDMWGHEYERLNDVLKATTDCFLNVRNNPPLLLTLQDCLNEFYRIIRPIIMAEQRKEKDIELANVKTVLHQEYRRYQSNLAFSGGNYALNEQAIETANECYNMLMDIRQVVGLGIKSSREVSDKQRIDRAVRGGNK